MIFSSRMPLSDLIALCRALHHNLDAGITVQNVFRQQADRGVRGVRPVAERIYDVIRQGYSLEDALEEEKNTFPPLVLSLVGVGENTGCLPEVFAALEAYYSLQQRLWRQFVSQCTLPLLQLFGAIFVIAGLIFILGMIAESNNTQAMDPLGVGLTGASGAIMFLCIAFGTMGGFVGLYLLSSRFLAQKAVVDGLLLRAPTIGPCLEALALARFCLAMRFTLETALPIEEALDLSLKATGNAAYAVRCEDVKDSVKAGEELSTALTDSNMFSTDFLSIIATAEESGRLPEVMKHQAKYYEEEAERRLTVLSKVAGFGVWAFVAILIIIAIFRIANLYFGQINQLLN